ncbi:MAG: CoA pyrophosphatase [Methylotenera sp.]|nr:CoA pyrophosphatase [Oligoflexia bacterium]
MMDRFEEKLLTALKVEPLKAHRPLPAGRPAAVLLLFGHVRVTEASLETVEPQLLLTKRTESVETHKGQYAFPGGSLDPEDHEEQGLITTALRETEEEVGIDRSRIRILGKLSDLWTVSGYVVTPVVGLLLEPIEDLVMKFSPHEIATAFWVPLSTLKSDETYRQESLTYGPNGDQIYKNHVFQVDEHRVWGATAAMIRDLLDRLAS